jgi:hypothetical protein
MQPTQNILLYSDRHATEYKEYPFAALTLADIETINLAVRAKIIRAARLSLEDCPQEFMRAEVLDSANRVAGEISLISGEHVKHFGSIEGQATILHIMLRKFVRDFTIEQAYAMVKDSRNDGEIAYAFLVMQGFTPAEMVERRNKDAAKGAKPETANPTTLAESSQQSVGTLT